MALLNQLKNIVNPNTIDDFKSSISKHGGLAKTNRFAVIITPPQQTLLNLDLQEIARSALSGTFSLGSLVNDPRDMALLCESTSLPGRQITTVDYASNQDWFTSKIPYGYTTDDVSMVFTLSTDYYMRKIFDRWQASIVSQKDYRVSYESKYYSDVIIQQLDEKNLPTYGIKLRNAFPVTVQSVPLDNNATDQYQKLSVTWAYEDFEEQGSLKTLINGVRNQVVGTLRRLI